MSIDDPEPRTTPGQPTGFQSYADDTPRDADDGWPATEARSWDAPMADLDLAEPDPLTMAPVSPRRAAAWPKIAVGVGVLAAFGVGYLAARTGQAPTAQSPVSVAEAAPAAPASAPLQVEIAEVAPIVVAPPTRATRMEVLPPSTPPATAFIPRLAPIPPRENPVLSFAPPRPAPIAPASREIAQAPVASDAVASTPPAPSRASFNCADAPTLARQMVCRDQGLAAMDQRMKQAYAAALTSGARAEALAADQADWLDVREEAARRSRWSVANIYRQRIDELHAIAAGERP